MALGGGPLGNLFEAIADDDALATVDRSWERGVRMFDTAPHYGLGLAERRLGSALKGRPRDEFELSTKVGRLLVEGSGNAESRSEHDAAGFAVRSDLERQWDFSADGVRRSLSDSLGRLGVDRIDIAYIHDPDDHLDQASDAAFPALAALRDAGVIRAVGVGANRVETALELIRRCDIDVVMIAGRVTLLDQTATKHLLPLCLDRQVAVVAAGVFNSGILAAPAQDPTAQYDYSEPPADIVDRVRRLRSFVEARGCSLHGAALVFAATRPGVDAVCFGARTPAEVDEALDALDIGVDPTVWEAAIEAGLIEPDVIEPDVVEPDVGDPDVVASDVVASDVVVGDD
ncbi:MAG: aldo/keto reductase [Ilumatobacteraceae bacterium]